MHNYLLQFYIYLCTYFDYLIFFSLLVLPVSTAIMTPIPLTILYIIKLIYQYTQKTETKMVLETVPSLEKLQQTTNISTITQLNESKVIDRLADN